MKIELFETELKKKFGQEMRIVPHTTNEDMAGVYWNEVFICGMPSKDIFTETKPTYTDKFGNKHRTTSEVEAQINGFFYRLKNEPGFFELMTEPL